MFLLIIILLVTSCKPEVKNNQRNIELVEKYYSAVNSGDMTSASKIVTEDFSKVNNDKRSELIGSALMVKSIEDHIKNNKVYKFIIEDIFASENKVAVRWKWESINIKQGTEKPVISQGISVFEIKNKKINKLLQAFDLLGFTKQLGIA